VARLESAAGAAAAAARDPLPVSISWSSADERVTARDLRPGEFVAADVMGYRADGEPWESRVVERVTRDGGDLGVVYDAAGARVGRVTAMDGRLLTLHIEATS
jgi:YD repeat-containing protein